MIFKVCCYISCLQKLQLALHTDTRIILPITYCRVSCLLRLLFVTCQLLFFSFPSIFVCYFTPGVPAKL